MFYVTGDTHADFRGLTAFMRRLQMTGDDCVILLGDAGFNFYQDLTDLQNKAAVNNMGVPVLCIHGNHEIRPARLPGYTLQPWHGGKVWVEPQYPRLLFARDGDIYDLDGQQAIVAGGAYSVDQYDRLRANPYAPKWWPDEQPGPATKQRIEEQLAAHGWNIDIVLSHTCPARFIPTDRLLPGLDQSRIDRSTEEWLDTIEHRLRYRHWFCGHWHINRTVDKVHFLYHDILSLGGEH